MTSVKIYAPNIGTPKYIKQILRDLKGEIDSNAITVGDFNTPLSTKDRSSRHKINKKTLDLNYVLDYGDLDIYRTFCLTTVTMHSSQAHLEHSPGYF